ncbi:hypothetical protein ABEB36_006639 [Hypothenemus hampei]|uniref:AAA-ATPase-like domain-containing protein n=1 Tax=Hypothenemus hampei TaxID=57062 RepID=A0ABD1ER91_HYPHA
MTTNVDVCREEKLTELDFQFDTSKYSKDIKVGLEFLPKCLYRHFKKEVFVFIDKYDVPINNALFEREVDMEKLNKLLRSIFTNNISSKLRQTFSFSFNVLKGNKNVCRGLLTRISYFVSVGLFGANKVVKFLFLDNHAFVKYYGVTDAKVNILMNRFDISAQEADQVRLHNNGYYSLS